MAGISSVCVLIHAHMRADNVPRSLMLLHQKYVVFYILVFYIKICSILHTQYVCATTSKSVIILLYMCARIQADIGSRMLTYAGVCVCAYRPITAYNVGWLRSNIGLVSQVLSFFALLVQKYEF